LESGWISKTMKTRDLRSEIGLGILFLVLVPVAYPQQNLKSDRKIFTRVEPDYPPVLRMRQIGGTVRLELTVTAGGSVENVKVLGGNPILAEAAVTAVKKWKYAPADSATAITVSLVFDPYR
jgi:TonB family protein